MKQESFSLCTGGLGFAGVQAHFYWSHLIAVTGSEFSLKHSSVGAGMKQQLLLGY